MTLRTVGATDRFLARKKLKEECFSKDKALCKQSLHQQKPEKEMGVGLSDTRRTKCVKKVKNTSLSRIKKQ